VLPLATLAGSSLIGWLTMKLVALPLL